MSVLLTQIVIIDERLPAVTDRYIHKNRLNQLIYFSFIAWKSIQRLLALYGLILASIISGLVSLKLWAKRAIIVVEPYTGGLQMKKIEDMEIIPLREIVDNPHMDVHQILEKEEGIIVRKDFRGAPVGVLLSLELYDSILTLLNTDADTTAEYLKHYQEVQNGDYSSFEDESVCCKLMES